MHVHTHEHAYADTYIGIATQAQLYTHTRPAAYPGSHSLALTPNRLTWSRTLTLACLHICKHAHIAHSRACARVHSRAYAQDCTHSQLHVQ